MPESKRPLKVFLCHAHSDKDAVKALYDRLVKDGVDAWLDKEKLLPGQDWELEIRKAVREADVVVVCLSKQFNQAGFRQKEVRLALDTAMEKPEGEIFIIPARLEECDNLESLRKWHWVDLFEEDGYQMLMRALRARSDRIGTTLQIKKSWLPMGSIQPAAIKKPTLSVEKPVEKKREEPMPKKGIQPPKNFSRNIFGIIGFILLVLVSVFGLPSLIGKPEELTPTATNIVNIKTITSFPASKTKTSIVTFTPTQVVTKTSTPSRIPTKTLMPTSTFANIPEHSSYTKSPPIIDGRIPDDGWENAQFVGKLHNGDLYYLNDTEYLYLLIKLARGNFPPDASNESLEISFDVNRNGVVDASDVVYELSPHTSGNKWGVARYIVESNLCATTLLQDTPSTIGVGSQSVLYSSEYHRVFELAINLSELDISSVSIISDSTIIRFGLEINYSANTPDVPNQYYNDYLPEDFGGLCDFKNMVEVELGKP